MSVLPLSRCRVVNVAGAVPLKFRNVIVRDIRSPLLAAVMTCGASVVAWGAPLMPTGVGADQLKS